MIRAQGLHKDYKMDGRVIRVLDGLDLEVPAGESLAIVGASGVGKSTLLNVIAGLDDPTSGEVWFGDQSVTQMKSGARARLRNRQVGFIFQSYHLLPELTAWENVLAPVWIGRGLTQDDENYARDLLARVGLSERLEHKPGQLSGGEQQRVAVARALANRPQYVFADEPTGNLDAETGKNLMDLLLKLCEERRASLLVVTHDSGLARRAGRRFRLDQGRLIREP